jgi:hypothetical protein
MRYLYALAFVALLTFAALAIGTAREIQPMNRNGIALTYSAGVLTGLCLGLALRTSPASPIRNG